MIEFPSKSQLIDILNREQGRCISILMPTEQSGRATNQNPIRFKNLLRRAIEMAAGLDDDAVNRLRELADLEQDVDFWRHQTEGLAILVCDGFYELVKLGDSVDEAVHLSDHFFVKPFAARACATEQNPILALSWDRARLFVSDGHSAHEISNESFPTTMQQLVLERDPEEQLQLTSHRARGQGGGPADVAMYHGHGEGEEQIEADRRHYLSRVGQLVTDELYNTGRSLTIVATNEVAGHFSAINDLRIANIVQSSPDSLSDSKLLEEITNAVATSATSNGDQFAERVGTALANQQGSEDIREIVKAAMQGKIEALVLGSNECAWGTVDRLSQRVTLHELPQADSIDLHNFAVHETLLASGDVLQDVNRSSTVAIYRY